MPSSPLLPNFRQLLQSLPLGDTVTVNNKHYRVEELLQIFVSSADTRLSLAATISGKIISLQNADGTSNSSPISTHK
jgi:hypothetical protein